MVLKQRQFYCVACDKRVTENAKDICVKKLKNGTPALKSKCKCGCKLTKFIKHNAVRRLKKKVRILLNIAGKFPPLMLTFKIKYYYFKNTYFI